MASTLDISVRLPLAKPNGPRSSPARQLFNKPPYFKYGADAQFPDPDSSAARLRLRWCGENDASSIKSKPQHISYPLDSSGARRRLLAAVSASRNGRRIKLHLKRKLLVILF